LERHLLLRVCAASLLGFGLSVAQAGINQWTTRGPPGGVFMDLEASPTNGNVFYAAYGQSFFRAADGNGRTWTEHPFDGQVNDIAVDPGDGDRLLVAVLQSGLFRSLDGGRTFTKIAPDPAIWAAAIGPNNVMYYATPNTFHRSTNGGDSFGAPVAINSTMSQIVVAATDANSVVGRRGPFFMRSTDGGANWSEAPITSTSDDIFSLERLASGTLIAALQSGLYSSTDNGANWTLRLPGFTWSVVAERYSPDALLAARPGPNVLMRSTDGGVTWQGFGAPPLGSIRRAVASSAAPNRLVVANDRGVQSSGSGGDSWSYASEGLVASGLQSMATTVAGDSRVYIYTVGASLFSTGTGLAAAGGGTWQRLTALDNEPPAQGTLAVKPGAPQSVYLALFGRGVYRSVNGGGDWTQPNADLAGFAVDSLGFDPVDPSIMYAAVAAGAATPPSSFYRSSNGGASWSPRSVDLPQVHAFRMAVDPANGARIFLAGYQGFFPAGVGGLYFSSNAGINWNRIGFAGQDVNDVAIDPSDSNRVYAATATGLHVSTDGGTVFLRNDPHSIVTTQPARRIVIDPAIPTTIYTATLDIFSTPQPSSFVLRSVDRGQTWETLRSGADAPGFFVGQLTLDPQMSSLIYIDTGLRGVAAYEIVNDLAITISGHSGVRPTGAPSTFQMRGENLGDLAATDVRLSATLPAGLTNVSATSDRGSCTVAGVIVTCIVPVLRPSQVANAEVTYTPPVTMALDMQAAISAHERDTTGADNSAAATATTGEVADLRVAGTPSATPVKPGTRVIYTVTVTNGGPIDSSSSVLTFSPGNGLTLGAAPAGCIAASSAMICEVGALANGAARSFQIPATVQGLEFILSRISIAGAPTAVDPNTTNNNNTIAIYSTRDSDLVGGGGGGSTEWMTLLALSVFLRRTVAARRGSNRATERDCATGP
jgi:uncharacterized repeat protein (TIGR01451 family)